MNNPFDISTKIVEALDPSMDEKIEKEKLDEKDEKSEISRQYLCCGCYNWIPYKTDFDPYDCPVCGRSRWGD